MVEYRLTKFLDRVRFSDISRRFPLVSCYLSFITELTTYIVAYIALRVNSLFEYEIFYSALRNVKV